MRCWGLVCESECPHYVREIRPHYVHTTYVREIWKRSFNFTVRPTVHTNPSRKYGGRVQGLRTPSPYPEMKLSSYFAFKICLPAGQWRHSLRCNPWISPWEWKHRLHCAICNLSDWNLLFQKPPALCGPGQRVFNYTQEKCKADYLKNLTTLFVMILYTLFFIHSFFF